MTDSPEFCCCWRSSNLCSTCMLQPTKHCMTLSRVHLSSTEYMNQDILPHKVPVGWSEMYQLIDDYSTEGLLKIVCWTYQLLGAPGIQCFICNGVRIFAGAMLLPSRTQARKHFSRSLHTTHYTGRKTDGQTERQPASQKDGPIDLPTYLPTYTIRTDKQTNIQTYIQSYKHTKIHTYVHTCMHKYLDT